MKQPVSYDFFTKFRFPYGLCGNRKGDLCFGVRRASLMKNSYHKSLWLWRQGKLGRLQNAPGDFSGHWWMDDDTLLLAVPIKDKALAPLPITRLLTLPITGEKPKELATLYMDIADIWPLGNGRLLVLATWDPIVENAMEQTEGDTVKAAKALRETSGAEVLTHLPFWANGDGFTAERRGRLYLFAGGSLSPLTGKDVDVDYARPGLGGKTIYYISRPYQAVVPMEDRLTRLELVTGEKTDLTVQSVFRHDEVVPLEDGGLLVAGSDMRRHGVNQNPAFYAISAQGEVTTLYDGGQHSGWQSAATDLAMPGQTRWFVAGETAYWLSTVEENVHLMRIHLKTGQIGQATITQGAVQEAALAGGEIFFAAMRGTGGPEVYRLEPDGVEIPLTRLNVSISAQYRLAPPQRLCFTNPEGIEIRGWVLKPPGPAPGDRCPAILNIHGGPKAIYSPVLFHEMQLWASTGYGVLFCNPTGGDGRGDGFADIRGRYGSVDYEDLMGFTDAALEQCPWIDETRLGVAGGSYGGFMVNWIIGHTHRFKVAVSQRGIASWRSMGLLSDIGYYFAPDQAGAGFWEETQALWDASPLKYAPQVKTPTLFIHSEEDYRCPAGDAMQMHTALRLHGVDTRMVMFRGENHELSRSGKPKNRLRRLEEMTAWFEKYLENSP